MSTHERNVVLVRENYSSGEEVQSATEGTLVLTQMYRILLTAHEWLTGTGSKGDQSPDMLCRNLWSHVHGSEDPPDWFRIVVLTHFAYALEAVHQDSMEA
jgi:hypothetical protein